MVGRKAVDNKSVYNLISLSVLAFFGTISSQCFINSLPFLASELGAKGAAIGAIGSSFMLARSLVAFLSGYVSDRIHKRVLFIALGIIGLTGAGLSAHLITSWEHVILVRGVQGFFSGITWITAQTLLLESAPVKWKTRFTSIYFSAGSVGKLLGIGVVTLIYSQMENSAYHLLFWLGAAAIGVNLLFLPAEVTVEEKRQNEEKKSSVDLLFKLQLLMALLAIGGAKPTITTVLMVHLKHYFSLTKGQTTFLFFVATCISIPFSYAVAHFADLVSKKRVYALLLFLGLISSLVVLSHNLFVVLVGIAAYFVLISAFKPLVRAMMTNLHGGLGAKIGMLNLAENIGGIVAPITVGALFDKFPGERLGFLFFAGLFAVSLLLHLWREVKKR